MKLAAIRKLVADTKRALILNDTEGTRWLGDGKNFYLIEGGLMLNVDNVLAALDVEKGKRDKITPEESEIQDVRFSMYPQDEDERLFPQMAVMYGNESIMLFATERREVMAIPNAALKPIEAEMGFEFGLRRSKGEGVPPAIICKADMFVAALLSPMEGTVVEAVLNTMRNLVGGAGSENPDD